MMSENIIEVLARQTESSFEMARAAIHESGHHHPSVNSMMKTQDATRIVGEG